MLRFLSYFHLDLQLCVISRILFYFREFACWDAPGLAPGLACDNPREKPIFLTYLRRRVDQIVAFLLREIATPSSPVTQPVTQAHVTALDLDLAKIEDLLQVGLAYCMTDNDRAQAFALLAILPLLERFRQLAAKFFQEN